MRKRGRINSIAPGIAVTPLAMDEFNGRRGDFYKNMFAKCPAGRPGTADEAAHGTEFLLSGKGAFITAPYKSIAASNEEDGSWPGKK